MNFVLKNGKSCAKQGAYPPWSNDEEGIKNHELFAKNDEFCAKTDEICAENDGFSLKMMEFA